jgi:hypothetical protein
VLDTADNAAKLSPVVINSLRFMIRMFPPHTENPREAIGSSLTPQASQLATKQASRDFKDF